MKKLFVCVSLLVMSMTDCYRTDADKPPTQDDLQFTFATSKASFGIHDTLDAAVTVSNQGLAVENVPVGQSLFRWSLLNADGKIIMSSPKITNSHEIIEKINPGQSKIIYRIRQPILDASGKPVVPGSYVLKAAIGSRSYSVNVTLK